MIVLLWCMTVADRPLPIQGHLFFFQRCDLWEKLIFESHYQLVKHWSFEMAASLTFSPNASVFDELVMRLRNQVFWQIATLDLAELITVAGRFRMLKPPFGVFWYLYDYDDFIFFWDVSWQCWWATGESSRSHMSSSSRGYKSSVAPLRNRAVH